MLGFKQSLIILISLLFWTTVITFTNGFKYDLTLDRFEPLYTDGTEDKYGDMTNLKNKKLNRTTYALSGDFVIKHKFSNELSTYITGYNFQGGQFKKIIDRRIKTVCTSVTKGELKELWEDLLKLSDMKVNPGCSINPGKYIINNYIFKNNEILPEYIPGNEKWRFDFEMYVESTKEALGGFKAFVTITPVLGSG